LVDSAGIFGNSGAAMIYLFRIVEIIVAKIQTIPGHLYLNAFRMNRSLLFACLLLTCLWASAQTALTEGAALLFKNTKSALSVIEKNKLFIDTRFRLSKDRKQFVAEEDENKDYPFDAKLFPTDLNKDGKEEIFIVFGNTFTSGNTGSSVYLFIKNTAGKYENQFGFPGMVPDALATGNKGYPDLVIGGPGMEYPVYRWNGNSYAYFRKISDADYAKAKKTSIEELSKMYAEGK
jgi:hypothetical protein